MSRGLSRWLQRFDYIPPLARSAVAILGSGPHHSIPGWFLPTSASVLPHRMARRPLAPFVSVAIERRRRASSHSSRRRRSPRVTDSIGDGNRRVQGSLCLWVILSPYSVKAPHAESPPPRRPASVPGIDVRFFYPLCPLHQAFGFHLQLCSVRPLLLHAFAPVRVPDSPEAQPAIRTFGRRVVPTWPRPEVQQNLFKRFMGAK